MNAYFVARKEEKYWSVGSGWGELTEATLYPLAKVLGGPALDGGHFLGLTTLLNGMMEVESRHFRIVNIHVDGCLWWNNEWGWGSFEGSARFSQADRVLFTCPADPGSTWVPEEYCSWLHNALGDR